MTTQQIIGVITDEPGGISVAVLGLSERCWKCGETTMLAAGLRFEEPIGIPMPDTNDGFLLFDDETSDIIAGILTPKIRKQHSVGEIKMRYSKSADGSYVSNGCVHCGAIQGNYPLQEVFESIYANAGQLAEAHANLSVITRLRVPVWVVAELSRRFEG